MMTGFLRKLFGRANNEVPEESVGLQQLRVDFGKKRGRREPPVQLDWSRAEYIPMPPSPPTWEVDGRDEFQREYEDPSVDPVFQAGSKSQHTKVVKLADGLSAKQRKGRVGDVIGKAYRKLIIQRVKAGQLAAAAKQSDEMFRMVPEYVQDADRRRFNRILKDMDKAGKKHGYMPLDANSPSSKALFTVTEGTGWAVVEERRLQGEERPDPAFAIAAMDGMGIWLLDYTGSSAEHPEVKSVLRRLDRVGCNVGDKLLDQDAYRVGGGFGRSSIALMDSAGRLHVYDESLNLVMETNLQDDPRVVGHFSTIDTNYWGEFRSQVRAVDVAPEGDRYLFTLADEAWCCTMSGETVWGVAMPLKEGWKRVVRRSERFGVGREVDDALRLFGLSLPVNPAEIKRKYRELAMANHPDRNPGNPEAEQTMKEFNGAFEVLTGVDPNTLEFEESDVTFFARTGPDYVVEVEGIRLEMTMTGSVPQDWVYAASFAASGGSAYVATYSGKVILLSGNGEPLVVYDIGTCPTEIVDTGKYTYFLTPTRLYVVEDRKKLAAFLDVFQQGRLLVTQSGFGLVSSKKLQWFTISGGKLGEILSRDPIRFVNKIDGGITVQTRQHQAEVRSHGL